MIAGRVVAKEARILLRVRGPGGRKEEVEAVIDTGYTGWLTLPAPLIAVRGLPWRSFGRGILADGSESVFNVYEAEVVWDRRRRRILVDEVSTTSLVGMSLLEGHELNVQVQDEGVVTIRSLRRRGTA